MDPSQTPSQSLRSNKYAKRLTRDEGIQVSLTHKKSIGFFWKKLSDKKSLYQENLLYGMIAKQLDISMK